MDLMLTFRIAGIIGVFAMANVAAAVEKPVEKPTPYRFSCKVLTGYDSAAGEIETDQDIFKLPGDVSEHQITGRVKGMVLYTSNHKIFRRLGNIAFTGVVQIDGSGRTLKFSFKNKGRTYEAVLPFAVSTSQQHMVEKNDKRYFILNCAKL